MRASRSVVASFCRQTDVAGSRRGDRRAVHVYPNEVAGCRSRTVGREREIAVDRRHARSTGQRDVALSGQRDRTRASCHEVGIGRREIDRADRVRRQTLVDRHRDGLIDRDPRTGRQREVVLATQC